MKNKGWVKVFLLILFFLFLLQGVREAIRFYRVYKEKERIVARNRSLKEENEALRAEIRRLKEDKRYLERLARKELGMIGKGEIVYRFK